MATAPRAAFTATACTPAPCPNSVTKCLTSHPDGTRILAEGSRDRVPALSGETVDDGEPDLSGPARRGRAVVVNTWSFWCPPCRAEAKRLGAVASENRARGVEFVGVNTRGRGKGAAAAFEEDFEVGHPSLYDPHGKRLLRFPEWHVPARGLPTTIVLDRKGAVTDGRIGPVGAGHLRRMIDPLTDPPARADRIRAGTAG